MRMTAAVATVDLISHAAMTAPEKTLLAQKETVQIEKWKRGTRLESEANGHKARKTHITTSD